MKIIKILTTLLFCAPNFTFGLISEVRLPLPAKQINFNPTKLYDQSSMWVARHLHCQLSRKVQGKVVLEAAESVDFTDPKKLKVILGSKYQFQDGSPITAEDVVSTFSLLKINRPAYQAQFSLVDKATAVNKNTVIFEFKEPSAKLFLDFYSTSHNPILPKQLVERAKHNQILLDSPIGCGNYKISQYIPGEQIALSPLKSTEPKIIFSLLQVNEITSDQVQKYDLIPVSINDIDSSKEKILKDFREGHLFDPYQIVFGLNSTILPWSNQKNRCDLFSKLNRSAVSAAYGSNQIGATDLFPKGVLGFNPTENYTEYYKKNSNSLPNLKGKPFCISIVNPSIPAAKRESYQKMISELYPDVTIKNIVDAKEFGPTFLNQNCDAIIIGFKSNNLDGSEFLNVFTESNVNYTGYWDENLKKEISKAQSIEDAAKRANTFKSLSKTIRDKCLIYPIITVPQKIFYVRKNFEFKDLEKSVLNEYYLGDVHEKQ